MVERHVCPLVFNSLGAWLKRAAVLAGAAQTLDWGDKTTKRKEKKKKKKTKQRKWEKDKKTRKQKR